MFRSPRPRGHFPKFLTIRAVADQAAKERAILRTSLRARRGTAAAFALGLLVFAHGSARAQLPPQLSGAGIGDAPPTSIAGLADARPFAPMEFSRAWLSRVADVGLRRHELRSAGELDGLAPARAAQLGAALAGTLRVPVIPVRYADVDEPFGVDVLDARLFGPAVGDTMTYASYFDEVSGGLLHVEGKVAPWVELSDVARHYLDPAQFGWASFGRMGELREEAVHAADAHIDFGQFDNDGPDGIPNSGDDDGYVDFVALLYATECPGNGRAGAIWPHRGAMSPIETNDTAANGGTIRISDYVILPGIDPYTCRPLHIGVLAHETGHALGLPDLYDYDGSSQGIGAWGLMGTGSHAELHSPAHMSAWSREQLGWAAVRWIRDEGNVTLDPGDVMRWDVPGASGRYLLLEARTRAGSDRMLPGEGLLVWEIDPERGELGAWNTDERRPAVALLQADGRSDLERGRKADAGDPFPGSLDRDGLRSRSDPAFSLIGIAWGEDNIHATVRIGLGGSGLVPVPGVVRLTALSDGESVSRIVAMRRESGPAFEYAAVADAEWLTAERDGDAVLVKANPRGLYPGAYTDTVRLVDDAGTIAARILVSFYVAESGIGQVVASQLPWSWGIAARGGQILQASYGWDGLGLRPRPRVLQLWEGSAHPVTLSRIPAEALYAPVVDRSTGATYVLGRAYGINHVYALRSDGQADAIASFVDEHVAYGAAALPDGTLLVASWNGTLRRVTRDGRVSVHAELRRPIYQITASTSGDVYAAAYDGNVLHLAPDGSVRTLATGFGEGRLVAVVAGADGAVYAAERGGEGRIMRIEKSGRRALVFRARGARFYGLAIDEAFLYALDLGRRELLRIPVVQASTRAVATGS